MEDVENNNYKFSVLMPVYYKEQADNVKVALKSILEQTLMPNEILIIEDGSLSEDLENVIVDAETNYPDLVRVIRLPNNHGIGYVRTLGVNECKFDYIAFMDSDDISRNDRFDKQIKYLQNNPNIDMVGSWITEFDGNPDNIYSRRILPTDCEDVYKFAKFRMPVNNNTILFKKDAVIAVGSYQIATGFEDYEVCGKLLNSGYKIANIPEFLVNMRAGQKMMDRRKGVNYFIKYEYSCMKLFYEIGFINVWEFIRNVTLKFMLRIIPNWLRNFIYRVFLRK